MNADWVESIAMTLVNPYQPPQAEDAVDSLDGLQLPRTERVTIDPQTLVEVHYARYGRGTSLLIRIAALVLGVLGGLLFAINARAALTSPRAFIRNLFAIVGATSVWLVSWAIFGDWMNRWLLSRWYSWWKKPKEIKYKFTHDGITAHGSGSVDEVRWSDVRKWQGDGDVAIAWYDHRRFLIFPLPGFSSETRDLIRIVRGGSSK